MVVLVVILGGGVLLIAKLYRRAPPGHALVVTTTHGMFVTRTGAIVYPSINQAEVIDLTVRALAFDRKGLATRDDQRIDVTATLRLKVSDAQEDIEKVARSIGCARAADESVLRELFGARFGSALASTVRELPWSELLSKREEVADMMTQLMKDSMQGFVIEDIAIDRIERAE